MPGEAPLDPLSDDAARVLALLRPVAPARAPAPPIAPPPQAEHSPSPSPVPPASAQAVDPGPAGRRRRDVSIPRRRSNKHALDPAAGRTAKGTGGPATQARQELKTSAFSRGAGVPTRHELLEASAELARRFHGQASTADGYRAKQAAVAFSVMVDKLTLLKSEQAPSLIPDEGPTQRAAVARLVCRIAALIDRRAAAPPAR